MAFDAHANFATSLVATAPSPATSGTSLVVTTGQGSRFPAPPFNAVIGPANTLLTSANAEIVRVTVVSTDTLTITRAQESSSARTVVVGDQIYCGPTAKTFTDLEVVDAAAATGSLRTLTAIRTDTDARYMPQQAGLAAPMWGPLVTGSAAPGTNLIVLARVVVPKTGTIHGLGAWVGTASGNLKWLIYDTGDSSAGNYSLLYNSGAIAVIVGGAAWQTAVDPALNVTQGQAILVGAVVDNASATFGRATAFANAAQSQLPASFMPVAGGASPKMAGQFASSYTTPATSISEANLANTTSQWVFFARVT